MIEAMEEDIVRKDEQKYLIARHDWVGNRTAEI